MLWGECLNRARLRRAVIAGVPGLPAALRWGHQGPGRQWRRRSPLAAVELNMGSFNGLVHPFASAFRRHSQCCGQRSGHPLVSPRLSTALLR